MNKTKIYKVLPLMLILFSLFILPTTMNTNAAVTKPDPFLKNLAVVFEGYEPDLSASMMTFQTTPYNASIPSLGLPEDDFYEVDIKSKDFQTDGITRTFSDSIISSITLSSAGGLYQTLQTIKEDAFSQYATDRDSTVYTFSTIDPFSTYITNEISKRDASWTYLNFTCARAYYVMTFDRTMVDAFFTAAKTEDGYALVASEHSTNKQMITTLLDDVFADYLYDMIHAVVNVTNYPVGLTVAEEIENVMSLNATDSSINGTTEIVSYRDAAIGYIGQRLALDSTIEVQSNPYQIGGFFGFKQTATTYTINLDIKSDVCTANTVNANYTTASGLMQPIDITSAVSITFAVGWGLLIAAGVGAIVALMAVYLARKSKNVMWIGVVTFLVTAAITFVIYIVLRLSVSIT